MLKYLIAFKYINKRYRKHLRYKYYKLEYTYFASVFAIFPACTNETVVQFETIAQLCCSQQLQARIP